MKIYYFCNKKKINMDKITGSYMTGLAISFRRVFPSFCTGVYKTRIWISSTFQLITISGNPGSEVMPL